MSCKLTPLQIQTMKINRIKENIQKNMRRSNHPNASELTRKVSKQKSLLELALLDQEYKAKVERMIHLRTGK